MTSDDFGDYTETGIPLGYRYESVLDIPIDVRPTVNFSPVSKWPKGEPGRRGPGPRVGRDRKTYWCRSCETAVEDVNDTWCDACNLERNSGARRTSRAEAAGNPTTITLPIEVFNRLMALTDQVIERISRATIEFDRPHMEGGAIDELMLATKDLAGFVSTEVNTVARTGPSRARAAGPGRVNPQERTPPHR